VDFCAARSGELYSAHRNQLSSHRGNSAGGAAIILSTCIFSNKRSHDNFLGV
jgi:hypothetical protein